MNLLHLENKDADTLKSATALLRRTRRRYGSAVTRIRRVEKFLEKHIAGLGYESEHLYGDAEPFKCPPEPVIVGLKRHLPRSYVIFFAKRDGEWHFYLALTTREPEGGTLILSDEAIPLVSAPAGVVLSCVDTIEARALRILEHLAMVVAMSSGDDTALTQPEAIEGKKGSQDPPQGTVH
ncbi:hypothetical protein BE04_39460 [Sorangium cellulosum]|uniref:Uncharacterized protein n=1 Tax=Sorangium cellulosum TaxID=56 RepID=A0A150PPW5_SORCE|nr:hypothetical protein BE04_39460 [Sorangium cellulosum]